MNEAIDYSTVKWVKQELDTTLKQARQALEAYVETPADDAQLRFCAVHLHQVHGTLRMVELHGAALLAEEMEHVIEALVTDSVAQRQDAYELVMRGILQLPDYLERLIAGHRDIPLVLLPLLNDLRATRGQNLLSEGSLFTPDLNAALPEELQVTSTGEDIQSLARNQRHSYQLALLGCFRGKDMEANLDRLRQVLVDLRNASTTDPMRRLWWAAEGVVVALQHGWLESGMSTKLLLGQMDRQIKRLIDEGEAALAADAPRNLLKNLLFYIAQAHAGGEPVTQIKEVYRLDALLPDQSEMEQAGVSLSGHNVELMATVSAAMKEDLARVKDVVDIFQRGGGKAVTTLQPAVQTLRQVTDTLGMLGLRSLRDVAQTQADAMAAMVEDGCEANDHVLMDVATALISIESSMDMLARDGTLAPAATQEEGGRALPDGEFDQIRMAVADEGIRDIAQAKDSILAFMENENDFHVLEP
ncbi:MAG TPA: Hpt domain-containing protein, partial [Wenzhouxiangella sp.]|nr:Hpt domain-containing protein [Wenzhouxiangella sp.]